MEVKMDLGKPYDFDDYCEDCEIGHNQPQCPICYEYDEQKTEISNLEERVSELEDSAPETLPSFESQSDNIKFDRIMKVYNYITEDVILALEEKAKFKTPLMAGSILSPDIGNQPREQKEMM